MEMEVVVLIEYLFLSNIRWQCVYCVTVSYSLFSVGVSQAAC